MCEIFIRPPRSQSNRSCYEYRINLISYYVILLCDLTARRDTALYFNIKCVSDVPALLIIKFMREIAIASGRQKEGASGEWRRH